MTDKNSKKHHYLPQFYINYFKNENNKVWVFNLEEYSKNQNKDFRKFIKEKTSGQICYIEDDNTIFDLDKIRKGDYPEQLLEKEETKISNFTQKLVDYKIGQDFPLSLEWPQVYAFFISLLYRNPNLRKRLIDIYDQGFIDAIEYGSCNEKQSLVKKMKTSGVLDIIARLAIPKLSILKLIQNKSLYNNHFNQTYIFKPLNAGNFEFLTSDMPMFVKDLHFETSTVDTFFINFSPQITVFNNFTITKNNFIYLNFLSIANADKYIFAKNKKTLEVYLELYFELMLQPEFLDLNKLQINQKLLNFLYI